MIIKILDLNIAKYSFGNQIKFLNLTNYKNFYYTISK